MLAKWGSLRFQIGIVNDNYSGLVQERHENYVCSVTTRNYCQCKVPIKQKTVMCFRARRLFRFKIMVCSSRVLTDIQNRAVARKPGHRVCNTKARLRSQNSPREIHGKESDTGTDLYPSNAIRRHHLSLRQCSTFIHHNSGSEQQTHQRRNVHNDIVSPGHKQIQRYNLLRILTTHDCSCTSD